MLRFPFAKINLGLNICRKREDGYHDLETALYPIDLCDALEIITSKKLSLKILGNTLDEPRDSNSCVKAWNLLNEKYSIPPVDIILLKKIPIGAGLGGGSSDAAFMLMMLNDLFSLKLSQSELERFALTLGSDCPFFISGKPVIAKGIGNLFNPITDRLKNKILMLVKPPFSIATAEAYGKCIPSTWDVPLKETIANDLFDWKWNLKNDFESSIFPVYPLLAEIKDTMYKLGAAYASMSGSGSSIYGIFETLPEIKALEKYGTCMISGSLNR